MNPIEKALDTADKVIAANAELERLSALGPHGVTVTEVDGKRVITIAQSVEQVKKEVLEILRTGVSTSRGIEHPTAADIKTFGDLHDYVDANCLGWLCDGDIVFADEQGLILDSEEGNSDRWIEFGNTVQEQVHQWLLRKAHYPVHVREEGCNPGTCSIEHALAADASLPDLHLPADDSNPEGVIQQSLVVAFDVTGWTRQQIEALYAAASAQGEEVVDTFATGSDDDQSHPDVETVNYEIIEHDGDLDLTGVLHVGLGL